ncbi:unnamed protein product [Allacma fusca]|uniref:Uncharacterized protein n=1 Tax=Allacma fusca TaxID=39272 RepID=A0A8J2KCI1_9HEXA|nr:unnamed protein product [Allacma fusca]
MMKQIPVNPGPVLTQINDVHLVSNYSQLVKIFLAERFTRTVITLIPMISSKPRSEAAMRSSSYPEILKTADFASTYFKIIDALAQRHNFTVIYVKEFLFNQRRYPCNYIIFPMPNMIPGKNSQIVFSSRPCNFEQVCFKNWGYLGILGNNHSTSAVPSTNERLYIEV